MSGKENLGLVGYDSFHFVVENLERSRAFYTQRLDFKEVARSSDDLVQRSGQQSVVFGAGDVRVCVSSAINQTSKAARYMKRHPAGVMSLSFRVHDLDRTMAFLDKRGGTFLADPIEAKDERGGRYRSVEIATPLGDVAFRFIERKDYPHFAPGFDDASDYAGGVGNAGRPDNDFGIAAIDHEEFVATGGDATLDTKKIAEHWTTASARHVPIVSSVDRVHCPLAGVAKLSQGNQIADVGGN